jgi:hypothetical protein
MHGKTSDRVVEKCPDIPVDIGAVQTEDLVIKIESCRKNCVLFVNIEIISAFVDPSGRAF